MHFVYSHGYAIPDYVKAEPKIPRGGVYRTKYTPRRTYDDLRPGFSMGAVDDDPIAEFGRKTASYLIGQTLKQPPAKRKEFLQATLAEIDPKAYLRTDARAGALRAQGVPAMAALEQSLAENLSLGLLEEFARVGKTGKVPGPESLGGFWSSVKSAVKKVGGAAGTVVSTVKGVACGVAGSSSGQMAAGVAGGPAAAAGAQILASTACGGGGQVVYAPPPQQPSMMPYILIGGALIAVVLLTRKD